MWFGGCSRGEIEEGVNIWNVRWRFAAGGGSWLVSLCCSYIGVRRAFFCIGWLGRFFWYGNS